MTPKLPRAERAEDEGATDEWSTLGGDTVGERLAAAHDQGL